jgi:protein translocase SecG subunit
MQTITKFLPYMQIVASVILITAILLQQSASGMGGALGGGDGGSFHHTRRGFEKFLFILSIVLGVLLVALALFAIIIKAKI